MNEIKITDNCLLFVPMTSTTKITQFILQGINFKRNLGGKKEKDKRAGEESMFSNRFFGNIGNDGEKETGQTTEKEGRALYFLPKSAGISPHSLVSHFRMGVV